MHSSGSCFVILVLALTTVSVLTAPAPQYYTDNAGVIREVQQSGFIPRNAQIEQFAENAPPAGFFDGQDNVNLSSLLAGHLSPDELREIQGQIGNLGKK